MNTIPLNYSEIMVLFLCGKTRKDFINDFKKWSGGIEPKDSDQLYTYLDSAIGTHMFKAIETVYEGSKEEKSFFDNSHWNYLNYIYG